MSSNDLNRHKEAAALAAVEQVRDGMRLGLGTGSTANFAIRAIGERWRAGRLRGLVAVPTSGATAQLARQYGIPLVALEELPELDLAIDGADEVSPDGQLIKGGGGALLREKAVERRARRLVIVVDESKLSAKLGTRFALPVEIAPGTFREETAWLRGQGSEPTLRGGEASPFLTENGNQIIDARFAAGIDVPQALARALEGRPNVRAHGLFLDMASEVIVAGPEGVRALAFR